MKYLCVLALLGATAAAAFSGASVAQVGKRQLAADDAEKEAEKEVEKEAEKIEKDLIDSVCASTFGDQIVGGKTNGGFVLLGSLCFPGGVDTSMTITAVAPEDGVSLLFYDDQPDSFPVVTKPLANGCPRSCTQREDLAKAIGVTHEIKVKAGGTHTAKIEIRESYAREWFVVATNCDANGEEQVVLTSYTISSDGSIPCSLLHKSTSTAGYSVSIVFLSILCVALAFSVVVLYNNSRKPIVDDGNLTGYNEL